jgi:hypothetical protein
VRGGPAVADIERDMPIAKPDPPSAKPRIDAAPPKPQPAQPAPRAAAAKPAAPPVDEAKPQAPLAPAPAGPSVRVLSGASQGRSVPFPGAEITVGRVGVQVAVVRKVAQGYMLIPIEGKETPRINGALVAPDGSPLHPGDTFEVAGVRLELSAD